MLGEATLDVSGTFAGEAIRLLILFAAPHRSADRRTAHATRRRGLPRLLHSARRQPIHQLSLDGCLGGLPAAGNAARHRAALWMREGRTPRCVWQELGRIWRNHACAAPFRYLGGRSLSFRRYGLRALLSARHAGGLAHPRRRRELN